MLHPQRVLPALKGNGLRQLRKLSGLKARPKAPVLGQSIDSVISRHAGLCRHLGELLPADFSLVEMEACEAGPGDCLATAALVLGLGARHVDLVELEPPVVNLKQNDVLKALHDQGFPVALDLIQELPQVALNTDKVGYHTTFMDNFVADRKYALVYSLCVGEHVENLETFFASCYRATKPGGINLHMIDLGGHGQFEDPVPPLDFQTYPDWLYGMMFPPFHRATRRFLGDYLRVIEKAGFIVEKLHRLREADAAYLQSIRPKLRNAARAVPLTELALIEFAVTLRRPGGIKDWCAIQGSNL
jgi:SAM-dependent methyltransferase